MKPEITQENIEYSERMQLAEFKKCRLSIETLNRELQELRKPRGLFRTTDKKAIAETEERLKKLNVHLIDILAMNGSEFYMYLKGREKSDKIKMSAVSFLRVVAQSSRVSVALYLEWVLPAR